MGVLLTIVTIAISGSAGVAAERRWPASAVGWARRLLVISLYTLIPFVVFFNLARTHIDTDAAGGLVIGWVAILITAVLAWLAATRLLDLSRPGTGALIGSAIVPNSGYLGYPLVASLLGFHALGEAVVYDVVVAAPSLLLLAFATGATFGDRAGESPRERVIAFFTRNPPLYAAMLAIVAPASWSPDVLVDISRVLVVAILPIGFFAVGAALAEGAEQGEVPVPPPLDPPVGAVILTRLVVAPALLLGLSAPFIDLPGSYLLLAAMPSGINTMIVTHAYGLDLRLTAGAVAWTTVIAVAVALGTVVL